MTDRGEQAAGEDQTFEQAEALSELSRTPEADSDKRFKGEEIKTYTREHQWATETIAQYEELLQAQQDAPAEERNSDYISFLTTQKEMYEKIVVVCDENLQRLAA